MSELSLHALALFGGKTAQDLWPLVDLAIFHWLLILLLPSWKYTPKLSLCLPILHAVLYTLCMISVVFFPEEGFEADPEASFSSLEGIVALFRDPTGVFVGWVHYLVFDALIGRWILLDSQESNRTGDDGDDHGSFSVLLHITIVVPCLLLTLMFGPTGWLIYIALGRRFILNKSSSLKENKKD